MTTSNPDYRPRLSVEISEEQAKKLRHIIPHGLQGYLFRYIVEDLIALYEEHGPKIFTVLMERRVKATEVMDVFRHDEDAKEN
jgi:hypothetical protein